MRRFLRLLKYVLPYKWRVVQNLIFNILGSFFALFSFAMVIPFLKVLFNNQPVVEEPMEFALKTEYFIHTLNYFLTSLMETHGKSMALVLVSIVVIVFSMLKNGFIFLANYNLAPVRAYTVRDIRNEIYRKVLRLPLSFYTETRKGDVMARVSNDVQEIEVSIMSSLQMLIRDPITIIVFMTFLFITSFKLTIFVLLILPFSGLLIGSIARKLRKRTFRGQQELGSVLAILEETLSGLRIIKGFNGEELMERKFMKANNRFARLMKGVMRRRQLAGPLSEFMGTIVLMILVAVGGGMVLSGTNNLSPETLIFYVIVFSQVIPPVKNFSNAWFSIQKGMASVDRIDELLNAEDRITELPDARPITTFSDSIEFRDVTFRYDKENVLRDINLTIKKGQLVALVGKSGAGKSTLVDLLPRFMDPDQGEVLIDGVPLTHYRIRDVRNLMGIVSQQSILFNDTFYNNIAFAVENAERERVTEAADVANATEFIREHPEGFDAGVGDSGSKLSGGQKQRVSIARALMANPPILILDEATSSLDTESERLVQDAIERLMRNRTSIVIAHRLSTIKNANVIYVMDEGRIVEQGTHDELIGRRGGVYKRLHRMQMF